MFNVRIMKRKSQQHFIKRYSLETQAYNTSLKCVLHIIVKITLTDTNNSGIVSNFHIFPVSIAIKDLLQDSIIN